MVISRSDIEIVLNRKKFNELDVVIKKKILFKAVFELFGTTKGLEKVHIEDVIKLCDNNIGNKYLTPNKNLKIELKNKNIYIQKK